MKKTVITTKKTIKNIPIEEDHAAKKIALMIYILYLIALLLPPLPLFAILFAYVFEDDTKAYLKSHYDYLIRSFWIGLLYFCIASSAILVLIGFLLIPLCVVWWIIRMAKGLKALLREQPILNSKTWFF